MEKPCECSVLGETSMSVDWKPFDIARFVAWEVETNRKKESSTWLQAREENVWMHINEWQVFQPTI